jgi:hypothetical protein
LLLFRHAGSPFLRIAPAGRCLPHGEKLKEL